MLKVNPIHLDSERQITCMQNNKEHLHVSAESRICPLFTALNSVKAVCFVSGVHFSYKKITRIGVLLSMVDIARLNVT